MKIAFIGGYGHVQLRPMLWDGALKIDGVAIAGDGVDNEKAKGLGGRMGEHEWFEDAHEMLRTFKPDIVNVGGIFSTNADWSIAVLEAGIPVLCEKPIATTWEQLARLKEVVKRTNGHLYTEFSFRCNPAFRAAHDAIRAGRIGEPVLVTGQKSYRFGKRPEWYGDRSLYGGTIGWVASHAIDAAYFCSGVRFTAVNGLKGNLALRDYKELEDHTVSMFQLENGGSCVIHADFLRPGAAPTHGDDRLRIVGTAGQLEIMGKRAFLTSDAEGYRDITDATEARSVHSEVLAAIDGRESVFSTADSLYIGEVLLAARDAADTKEWQSIG